MALQDNITLTLNTTNDTELKLVERSGTKTVRRARYANGDELTLTISHDEKKRDRHLVECKYDKAATATTPTGSYKEHSVIDQAKRPYSDDPGVKKLSALHTAFVTANIDAILLGES